ncbi:unnamed protein product [marine sediment metagenome]|uniref:Uncharacterized protein n=1 Tax=marine sediment metagenome TaxID=412755 RepID=X1MBW3_9ZZZZ
MTKQNYVNQCQAAGKPIDKYYFGGLSFLTRPKELSFLPETSGLWRKSDY